MQFIVALVTPFDSRGQVDLPALRAHVMWLVAVGVDGFLATGTTGEFPYLTDRERKQIHRTVIDAASNRKVFACPWDPSPLTMAYLSRQAVEAGADLVVPPPLYYRLAPQTVGQWFMELREKVGRPMYGYHNPAMFRSDIDPELYDMLLQQDVLCGLKDSSMDIHRVRRLAADHPGSVFGGGDRILGEAATVPGLAGFISAMGNAWPELCMRIFKHGETERIHALMDHYAAIKRAGGVPALKTALRMGCRMPMVSTHSHQSLPAPELNA